MYRKFLGPMVCGLALVLFFSVPAFAHNVTVFAWVDGNKVFGESKFSGGRRPKNADVIVWDAKGNELLRTKTDDNGEFSFEMPQKKPMRIELIAGMGHKGEWKITREDLGEVEADSDSPGSGAVPAQAMDAPGEEKGEAVAAGPSISEARLEAIVETAVAKAMGQKLKPVMTILADLEEKGPSVNDVMGGIGYIFGLMGVAAYFKSRQKKG